MTPQDARVYAAAPRLLAALIAVTDELAGLSGCAGTDKIVDAARDAIELATGDRYAQCEED